MASNPPGAIHGSSAHVGQGVLSSGLGSVTVGSIIYNNQEGQVQQHHRTLKESLDFPERAQRERAIRNVHRDTGRWFLRTEQYLNWQPSGAHRLINNGRLDEDDEETGRCCGVFPRARTALRKTHGSQRKVKRNLSTKGSMQQDWRQRLLWIKGNAGAGKSTLLKMVINHDRTTHTQALILPHFFNARGSLLERSTIGMYRTLICWLLEHQPKEFAAKLDPTGTRARQGWEIPELERLLNEVMGMIDHPSVVFYIDALDECDEAQVRDMLEYFRNLVKTAWVAGRDVRVCFASRPYPHITFEDAVFLDLSQQQEHIQDIETYINDRLRIEESILAAELHRNLLKKAAGVFMWAVLVIEMLNQACDEGRVERLPQMLEEIPPGLHELFAYTLERYPEDRDATLVCFRWLLFSGTSMNPSQVWWAVQLGLGLGDEQIQRNYERMSEGAMNRYIVGISKGFVEFKRAHEKNAMHAQFVHESVRDFLLNEDALQKLYGVRNRTDFEGQSHDLLRDWFAAELVVRRSQLIEAVNKKGAQKLMGRDLVKIGWGKDIEQARTDITGISHGQRHIAYYRYPQRKGPVQESGGHKCLAEEKEERKVRFPLAWLASLAIWEQIEAAQQCGRDQKAFLGSVLKRFGPYLFGTRFDPLLHDSDCQVYCNIISPLLMRDCVAVIRQTQLESAQLARRAGQAFGLIDSRSVDSPMADARRYALESVRAVVEIYLQLEPLHPDLRELLRYLARSVLRRPQLHPIHYDSFSEFGPLVGLAAVDASLATFFVLVLASPGFLSHLDTLKRLAYSEADENLLFLKVLLYFVELDLQTDALDYSSKDTLNWALNEGKYYNKDDSKEAAEIGGGVLTALSALITLLRGKYHRT